MISARAKALERYTLLQPYLEGHCSLQHLSKTVSLKYRTVRRWVQSYHEKGLAGLVRKSRRDKSPAQQQAWNVASYNCVYTIIRTLDHEGTKAYQQFDLLYRRQAQRPNEIWQADHCLLDIWLHHDDGSTARPWLTVIQDDYGRPLRGII